MKSFVYIALLVFLGSILVQAYGPKRRQNYRGRTHRPPYRSPDEFQPSPHDGPTYSSPFGLPYYQLPQDFYYFSQPYGYFGPPQYWDDSTEWDSGLDSREDDEYSSENYGILDDWHDFHHNKRPCKRHCKKPTKKPSSTASTFVPKATRTDRPRQTSTTVSYHTTSSLPPMHNSTPRPTRDVSSTEALQKTTGSSQPTTTTQEEFPTLSPEIISCFESCRTTPEFNPVCGTDGETYENEGKLFCAKNCGVDVSLQRRSVCAPPIFSGDDEGSPPAPPTTTSRTPIARTTSVSSLQWCMKQCTITPYITPVCGTNFVTYMNIDRLECARECGEDVEVLCKKPCAACGTIAVTVKPKTTPTTMTTGTFDKIILKPNIKDCLSKCPATMESNSVCGTDGITYRNPSHLLCAQLCGVGVSIDRFSSCLPTATTTTTTTTTTSEFPTATTSQIQQNCFSNCPVTSEYNPVCGTDDQTYSNPSFLECSKSCGIKVELKNDKPCDFIDYENDNTEITTFRTTQNIKEDSEELARRTATTTSLFTSPTQTTTPVSTLTTTTLPIPFTTTAPISTTTRFSIPANILNEIFGSTTTQSPPTVNPDDDEDLDIDDRLGNDAGNKTDISRIIFPE